jgi:TPR repeat protein
MKSSLNPSDYILPPKSLSERLASEGLIDLPAVAEPTVSAIAERFAPEPPTPPEDNPVRPVPEFITIERPAPEEVRRPLATRGMMAVLIGVALVPAALLIALLTYGAVRMPSEPVPVTEEARPRAAQQQAAAATLPLSAPAVPEIALTAPSKIAAKAGEEVAFDLAIDSSDVLPARSAIAVSAMPEGAVFSQGRPYGTTEWNLKPDEIGDLRLRLPVGHGGASTMRIELVAADGAVLARAETRVDIAAGLIVRADESNRIGDLISHGEKMIHVGYLAGARAYFKRAAEAGSGDAALAVGATYDADFIAAMGVQGIKADEQQAREWYGRAEMLGVRNADAKLAALREAWTPKAAPQQDANAAPTLPAAPAGGEDLAAPADVAADDAGEQTPRVVDGAPSGAFTLGPALEEWVEIVKPVNLREGPSDQTEASKVVARGVKFKATARNGNWVQVSDPSTSDVGWVYARFVKPTEPPEDQE